MRVPQVLVEGPTPVPSSGCRGSVHTKAGAASLPGMMLRLCIGHMPRSSRASSEPRSSLLPCGAERSEGLRAVFALSALVLPAWDGQLQATLVKLIFTISLSLMGERGWGQEAL